LHKTFVIGKYSEVFRGDFLWGGRGGVGRRGLHGRIFAWGNGIFHEGVPDFAA